MRRTPAPSLALAALAAAALLVGGCTAGAGTDSIATRATAPLPIDARPSPVFVPQKVALHRAPTPDHRPLTLGAGDRLGWALFDRHTAATATHHPAGAAYATARTN